MQAPRSAACPHELCGRCCRYLVAIAGMPGSGKSTAAAEVARRLNERRDAGPQPTAIDGGGIDGGGQPTAIAVPMDGGAF